MVVLIVASDTPHTGPDYSFVDTGRKPGGNHSFVTAQVWSASRVTQRMATQGKTAEPQPLDTEPRRDAKQESRTGALISSPIKDYLAALHEKYAGLDDGQVATYIPELAKANPSWFGICVATTDGHVYEVGDTGQAFTIQSISKPIAYGLALEDQGRAAVLERVGVEPSGDAFNSISLEPGTGRPLNPMINAGAITTTSLVAGATSDEKLQRLLAVMSAYAGRPLSVNQTVYQSEKETGHRNRAIGHMLRNFDILTEDPTGALDVYFQQCSIEVTCRDLALMGATLANGGVHPGTGERAIRDELVERVLSVMMSCGMYDYAGEWLYDVGMPAKSGVAGGIMAVLPGQLGISVYSPRLDLRGNSVRGIKVCQELSRDLELHALNVPRPARGAIRASYSVERVRSKRRRRERERRHLDEVGHRAQVFELQGDLVFSTTELAVRKIADASATLSIAVVDFRRVTHIDTASAKLLLALFSRLRLAGKLVLLSDLWRQKELERMVIEALTTADVPVDTRTFRDLDHALEHCEARLLATQGLDAVPIGVPLGEHDLLRGLPAAASAAVQERLRFVSFRRGETLVRQGDSSGDIYLLTKGEVSVVLELPGGEAKRLSTLSAGMTFGELTALTGGVRTADVRADSAVECYVLTRQAFDALIEVSPVARLGLLENMLRSVAALATSLTNEVAALEA
jgi:glutaminase